MIKVQLQCEFHNTRCEMADITVTIEQGTLKGSEGSAHNGRRILQFKGIPYAKPPLGDLRFKAPQLPQKWTGLLDATEHRDQCFSRHIVFDEPIGSEDCLYLNVYTPNLPSSGSAQLKPVMVFIHGGGFVRGSGDSEVYGPEFLLMEDIVLVTFNYRLGLLGFLSLEDPSLGVSGNAGLKDQVMALKWVQKNISKFGGDPRNVTIFGESAGAASVHYLMLSPTAKGLFHKAIAQSGVSLSIWATGTYCAKRLGKVMGIETQDESKILEHLQRVPLADLLEAQEKLKDDLLACEIRPVGPVIENSSSNSPFLTEHPLEIFKSGNYTKVPFIIGYNDREGIFVQIMKKKFLITDFEDAVPWPLRLERGSVASKTIARKIKEFYYGDTEPSMENMDAFYKLQTDNLFLREIYKTTRLHMKSSSQPIFLYRFSVDASLNLYKRIGEIDAPGACHADELGYLFKNLSTHDVPEGSVEDLTIRRLVKFWTNFAKHGHPIPRKDYLLNVQWKPVSPSEFHCVDIGEELEEGKNPDIDRISFWDKLLKEIPSNKL